MHKTRALADRMSEITRGSLLTARTNKVFCSHTFTPGDITAGVASPAGVDALTPLVGVTAGDSETTTGGGGLAAASRGGGVAAMTAGGDIGVAAAAASRDEMAAAEGSDAGSGVAIANGEAAAAGTGSAGAGVGVATGSASAATWAGDGVEGAVRCVPSPLLSSVGGATAAARSSATSWSGTAEASSSSAAAVSPLASASVPPDPLARWLALFFLFFFFDFLPVVGGAASAGFKICRRNGVVSGLNTLGYKLQREGPLHRVPQR